jgi:hypothetical protein
VSSILDQIKAADGAGRVTPVVVPQWGGLTVFVHRLGLDEKLDALDRVAELSPAERIAYLIALSVRDGEGGRVFDPADLPAVIGLDTEATAELWRVVKAASKLFQTDAEADAAKKD